MTFQSLRTLICLIFLIQSIYCQSQYQIGSTICGENEEDSFGFGTAISGDGSIIAFGARFYDTDVIFAGTDVGMVKVFHLVAEDWVQLGQTLYGVNRYDNFGFSVELSDDGNRLAVGYQGHDVPPNGVDYGRVVVYENIDNVWTQIGSAFLGGFDRQLGRNISFANNGDRLAIGYESWSPAEYAVFDFDGLDWVQVGATVGRSERLGDWMELSSNGNCLVASYSGAGRMDGVKVFELVNNIWTKKGDDILVEFKSGSTTSGATINATGDIIAFGDQFSGSFAGTAFVFKFQGNAWQKFGEFIYGTTANHLGADLDLSDNGRRLAVHMDPSSVDDKKVRIFDFNGTDWQVFRTYSGDGSFGRGMCLSRDGSRVAVGSSDDNCNGRESGNGKVFGAPELSAIYDHDDFDFQAYPNPVANTIYFEGLNVNNELMVYDTNGKLLFIGAGIVDYIDTNSWPCGVLIIQVRTKNYTLSRKIIKY